MAAEASEAAVDGVGGQAADGDGAVLADGAEQRARECAADGEPGVDGGGGAAGDERPSFPPAVGGADGEGAVARVVVGDVDSDGFGAAQSGAVEEGEDGGVERPARAGVAGAGARSSPAVRLRPAGRRPPATVARSTARW